MAQIGELPDTIPETVIPEEPELVLPEEAEVAEGLTFQDIAYAEGAEDPSQEGLSEEEVDTPEGLYADLEEEVGNEVEEAAEAAAEGADEYTPRANERIQSLVQQRKEAEAQAAAMQQQMQQMQAQLAQQQQAAQQQLAQQNQMLQQQMQAMQQAQLTAKRQEEDANLTPFEKWQRDQKAEQSETLQQMEARLRSEFEQKAQQDAQKRQQALAEFQRKQRYQSIEAEADKATSAFLEGLPEEDASGLHDEIKAAVLTMGAAFGIRPEEAMQKLEKTFTGYRKADHKRRLAASKAKPKAAAKRSRVVRPTSQQASVDKQPDYSSMSVDEIFKSVMRSKG